ncbi:hypothetical protein IFM89_000764 [Coptis chinensis]|uniref:Uncharacterized protein n=1 Tax=Coptis chinensis TaxID=261450 RepID=A0A835M8J7_9MAGN|nr:hypothetical protein IFM89_000764 [Coptis chinensis]
MFCKDCSCKFRNFFCCPKDKWSAESHVQYNYECITVFGFFEYLIKKIKHKRCCIHRGGSNVYANSETQKVVMRMRNILDDVRVRSYAIKMLWINNEVDNLGEYYEKNFEGLTFLKCMEFLVEVLTKYINLDESDEEVVCPCLKTEEHSRTL